ncbi:helix-turn-helix domain-containing protein [Pedobacter cryoconitis]|uniref:Repressor LexA n=1 Tax=Pedobacter cryoconitis TaxID=188932 RepID=A0A327SM94_9SPHI|nr:helix-turn-helix transcriptional regulator [Pedobacter cryoconitis]RAJ28884.1 repressor LexA [Pedobacter cryoconitis]
MKKEGLKTEEVDGTMIIVGKNIVKFRKLKGLSAERLGILCDVEQASISKYENGKVWPNLKTLSKIASALGIKIVQLFED